MTSFGGRSSRHPAPTYPAQTWLAYKICAYPATLWIINTMLHSRLQGACPDLLWVLGIMLEIS